MKVTTDFVTGSGKGITQLDDAHFALQMRRDKYIYENYFHFRIEFEGYSDEAIIDIYPDQDYLPQSRRILASHFSPATLWHSPQGPFTTDVGSWRPVPGHLVEWRRDFIRLRTWLVEHPVEYVSSHHPLTAANWLKMLQERAAALPDLCSYHTIGSTPQGRPIGYLRIGTGARRVLIIASQHPIETPSSWAVRGIIDYLTSSLPQAQALLDEYCFECFAHVNPDGLDLGNPCFNASGVDLFLDFGGAAAGDFRSVEARLLWEHAVAGPLALVFNFHCYMGGYHHQDPPGEGIYMIPDFEEVFSPQAARSYRIINDHVIFSTDAFSSRYRPSELSEDNLCYQLARQHDVPSVFYEFNGAFSGPYRNTRNGIRVFVAAMDGLAQAGG